MTTQARSNYNRFKRQDKLIGTNQERKSGVKVEAQSDSRDKTDNPGYVKKEKVESRWKRQRKRGSERLKLSKIRKEEAREMQ